MKQKKEKKFCVIYRMRCILNSNTYIDSIVYQQIEEMAEWERQDWDEDWYWERQVDKRNWTISRERQTKTQLYWKDIRGKDIVLDNNFITDCLY